MNELPHNEEAESAVLGAILVSPNVRHEIFNSLIEEDFYGKESPNALVFRAIGHILNDGRLLDLPALIFELDSNMKVLDKVGGVNYLKELADSYLGDKNAIFHRNTVKDLALSRNFINCLNQCLKGFEQKEFTDPGQYVAQCEKNILDITQGRRVNEFASAGELVEKITKDLREQVKEKGAGLLGVTTGYSLLDYYTQGWQPGQFNILAARPSVGKTAFALNLAYNTASRSGRPVAFFSLEMDAKSIMRRMLAFTAKINSMSLSSGKLNDDDWIALDSAVNALKGTNILIDDTAGENLADIKTKVQKLKAEKPDLACIFIDYLGLITTSGKKFDSRQNEVAEISRQLKALAREVEVPIICLSQLSRESEKRSGSDRMPKLSDLRDSGSIEQDADIVMFIHRDDYQNAEKDKEKENEDPTDTSIMANVQETKINISKNRQGKTGIINYTFFMNMGLFSEVDKREEQQ